MGFSVKIRNWSKIFKALGSPNRLMILKILSNKGQVSVTALSEELGISLKNTSRNLSILLNLDLVEYEGKSDHVYYSLNKDMDKTVSSLLKVIL
ncbi:MAG: hypothetical protein A3J48_00340 [Candidatus Doudnabacteria bacterium RIFCSPHIGHO2_02_FULL_46_11]|uniref:HTH arsR-type domain-containing protein n=1 Tax=Candidatus Doudnabacteria bacterium RIFCSPHIGHO2_02_FULL_46_11 TaxID=1817832 RepID=A0A1F5P4Y7_9BACT|nr:MAG: hypothetical protein A3J48_00340 [Candidatus Doudnabacteria bacterium RIFCSPHIGHO2_02_FULL_46_11]